MNAGTNTASPASTPIARSGMISAAVPEAHATAAFALAIGSVVMLAVILVAWVVTLPFSAALAWGSMMVLALFFH